MTATQPRESPAFRRGEEVNTVYYVSGDVDLDAPYDDPAIAAKAIALIEQDRRLGYDGFEATTPEESTAVCDAYAALTANPISNPRTER